MFQLTTEPFGTHTRYRFAHPVTGDGFSVVPSVGATLLDLQFKGREVLDGYESAEALEIGKWGKSAILFPFPNRLRDGQYTWESETYQFPINNAPMNNAIHGFLRHVALEPVRIELSTESAEITCRYVYDGHLGYYPFPLTLETTFNISARNDFSVTFMVRNQHTASIPVGFGWHPYFSLADTADAHSLQLPAADMVGIDERMIPTGSLMPYTAFQVEKQVADTKLDNCFKVADAEAQLYRLQMQHGGHTLSLTASKTQWPYFQVFTPPARKSIALEPMTCNVDAFNNGNGLMTIPAGGDWVGAFRIEYA
jgi:aldose 1-epimerase